MLKKIKWKLQKNLLCWLIARGKKYLELKDVKSICILRWDNKLGDSILMSQELMKIREARPEVTITIITNGLSEDWIRYKEYDVNIINCGKPSRSTAKKLKAYKNQFDVLVMPFKSRTIKEFLAIYYLNPNICLGFDKSDIEIFDYSSSSLNIRERTQDFVRYLCGDFPLEGKGIASSQGSIERIKGKVAFNFFGAAKERTFSKDSAVNLVTLWVNKFTEDKVVLVPTPNQEAYLNDVKKLLIDKGIQVDYDEAEPSFDKTLSILKEVEICITPDTSVVHMCSTLNTPILAIYPNDPENYEEWKPLSDNFAVVFNKENGLDVSHFDKDNFLRKAELIKSRL